MKRLLWPLLALLVLGLSALPGAVSAAAAKPTVKIGFIAPLTGPSAAIGLGMRNAAELAVRQANASGKYPYRFQLVPLDDASDPAQGVAAANKAASDPQIVAVAGHFNSGVALATIHVYHKFGIPAVIVSAIHHDITGPNYPEITRVITEADVQNAVAGRVATKQFGMKTFSIIHDKTTYGKSNAEQFMAAAKKYDGVQLSFDGIDLGQRDFSAVLTRIKALNPDLIYFGGVANEAALIRRQMKDLGLKAAFMSDSGILSDTFNTIAGAAAEGTVAHAIGKPLEELPKGKEFLKAYEAAKFKEPPEAYAPFAYDAVNIIIAAVKKAGPNRAKLVRTIRQTRHFPGLLGDTTFDDHGQTKNELITTMISEGGKWMPYAQSHLRIKKQ